MNIPSGFNGIIYEPSNEQETIALFLLLMSRIRPMWCIKKIQTAYPDATFYDTESDRDWKVEFEYLASGFLVHDQSGCDIVICWRNDLSRAASTKLNIEVIALSEVIAQLQVADVFLGHKQEWSLDKMVQDGVKRKDRVAIAVDKLVNVTLPALSKKYTSLFVDRDQTRHYVVRWEGKGLFGIYPSGRLVAHSPQEFEKRFGGHKKELGVKMRRTIKDIIRGLDVSPKVPDEELEHRITMFEKAMEAFLAELALVS